jgi:hypothetical protein
LSIYERKKTTKNSDSLKTVIPNIRKTLGIAYCEIQFSD